MLSSRLKRNIVFLIMEKIEKYRLNWFQKFLTIGYWVSILLVLITATITMYYHIEDCHYARIGEIDCTLDEKYGHGLWGPLFYISSLIYLIFLFSLIYIIYTNIKGQSIIVGLVIILIYFSSVYFIISMICDLDYSLDPLNFD